jgi:hypothetical protein
MRQAAAYADSKKSQRLTDISNIKDSCHQCDYQ